MKNIEYLICDLDNTLLFHGNEYHEEDLDALRKWTDAGKHLWIATGRSPVYVEEIRKRMQAEYMIANTGACIANMKGDVRILWYIDHECANDVFSCLDTVEGFEYRLITDGSNCYEHVPSDSPRRLNHEEIGLNVHELLNHPEEKLLRIFGGAEKEEILNQARSAIEKRFAGILSVMETSPGRLDIVPYGCDKWNAALFLMDSLKIDPCKVASIGDAETDVKMLASSEMSFAVSNANPQAKKVADFIVSSVKEAIDILMK